MSLKQRIETLDLPNYQSEVIQKYMSHEFLRINDEKFKPFLQFFVGETRQEEITNKKAQQETDGTRLQEDKLAICDFSMLQMR